MVRGYGADLAVLVDGPVLVVVDAQADPGKKKDGGQDYKELPSHDRAILVYAATAVNRNRKLSFRNPFFLHCPASLTIHPCVLGF